jgi:transcriptional regulator with XRE-family HTH domain
MEFAHVLREARTAANLTQTELAALTGIARPNIVAYETGRREPLFTTAHTLINATQSTWEITPPIRWHWTATRRPYAIPSRLWRLPIRDALQQFDAGTHLWWSGPPRTFNLAVRSQRHRAYEIVLREGGPDDISTIVDGVLVCDAWPDLVLPSELRAAWQPLIDKTVEQQSTPVAV